MHLAGSDSALVISNQSHLPHGSADVYSAEYYLHGTYSPHTYDHFLPMNYLVTAPSLKMIIVTFHLRFSNFQ